ncbi:hypothetical protein HZS_4829 [Henneguya salminicola]|nr:hypothetical protein HZS_4829 [Henneguya salminicola]
MSNSYDYLFKLLIIGDSSVGKTCILFRFSDDSFQTNFISTIGIDFKMRTIILEGKRIKLQIWDTAGQERFRTITTAYYRGAMGIFVVFDVTNKASFNNVASWLRNCDEHGSSEAVKIILGNKSDSTNTRVISYDEAKQFASQYGAKYMEVSAKNGDNINEAFTSMAADIKAIMDKRLKTEIPTTPSVNLSQRSQSDKKESCC